MVVVVGNGETRFLCLSVTSSVLRTEWSGLQMLVFGLVCCSGVRVYEQRGGVSYLRTCNCPARGVLLLVEL